MASCDLWRPCRRPRSLIKRVTSGGLPHLGGLPYLPGVPHLHVNRPKVASTITLIHLPPVVCDAPLNYRLIKTLESVSCSIKSKPYVYLQQKQDDIERKRLNENTINWRPNSQGTSEIMIHQILLLFRIYRWDCGHL